jgi:hypothetical protein
MGGIVQENPSEGSRAACIMERVAGEILIKEQPSSSAESGAK